jgi:hypothetical protein
MSAIRPVILVTSCREDQINGRQWAAENTWAKEWHSLVDIQFVSGFGGLGGLVVDAPDTREGVGQKNQRARQWALAQGYDYIFHACVDTWIDVPALLASGFEAYDYTGYRCDEGHAGGGAGYWLSAKAARVLAALPPTTGYEDLWVGTVLSAAGIHMHHDDRYSSPVNPNRPVDEITLHLSRGTGNFDPQWMYECHKQQTEIPNG